MKKALLRRTSAAAIAALTLTLGVAAATADDVANTLDTSVDATAEVMSLTAGGATGSTKFYVQPRQGDGETGCNLKNTGTLTVDVVSSDPTKATVSPSRLTFDDCVSAATSQQVVTVTPVAAGSTTVSLTQFSSTTTATFNLAPASFRVDVGAGQSNTGPTVSVTGVTGGSTYEHGSVPAAGCSVVDTEDGPSTFAATLGPVVGPLAAYGLGSQTASCSYTDGGGLTASSSTTYAIADTTAPSITFVSRVPAANGAGWNSSDVTLTWSCSDSVGIDASESTTTVVLGEGADQSATGVCTDVAGNSVSDTRTGINVDKTLPTISAGLAPSRPATTWWNISSAAPTVTYTCGDALSGVASCTAPHTFLEGEDQVHSGSVTDLAGNTATAGVNDVDVDLTAPGVSWVGGPADGASYYFGSVPAVGTCAATDALSGPDGCTVTGYGTTVGSKTLTATAGDLAGNTTAQTRSYSVLAWTLGGFFQPVDMGANVWNTVKNGSTVPLKFEVFAGTTELTDKAVVDTFTVKGVTCPGSSATTDDIELVTTGATELRYDVTGGQFIQNWQTPKKPGACYQVTMTTDDGSSISANFKLR